MSQKEKKAQRALAKKQAQQAKRFLYLQNALIISVCLCVFGWFIYSVSSNFIRENKLDVHEYVLQDEDITSYMSELAESYDSAEAETK